MKLKKVWAVTVKEFHQLKRDKKMYPILFMAPVLQLIILGYAATFDIRNTPVGIYDADRTQLSRTYSDAFSHNRYFDVCYRAATRAELCSLLDRGEIKVGVDIPLGFQEKLKSGLPAQVQLFIDGTESNGATIALSYASIISRRFSSRLALGHIDTAAFSAGGFLGSWRREAGSASIIDNELRIWYNPELSSSWFFVPGVICMVLLIVTTNLTAISIVREKEIGTLEQLMATPVTRAELLLGKLAPFTVIGLFDVALIVSAALLVFQVPLKGSAVLLFVFSFFFLFSTLGLGLFVSTVTRTQEQAMIVTFFFLITMVLLSGIIFPIENMPPAVQLFTYLMPIRYFAVIVRSLFLKGVGLAVLWDEGALLALLGLGILVVSLLRFHKKVS